MNTADKFTLVASSLCMISILIPVVLTSLYGAIGLLGFLSWAVMIPVFGIKRISDKLFPWEKSIPDGSEYSIGDKK